MKLIQGDCLEEMKKIKDDSVDVIICDPPYFKIKGDFDFKHTLEEWKELHENLAKEFKRIIKNNGSVFLFGHAKRIAYQQIIFDKYFNLENSLVWEKKECQTKRGLTQFRCFAPITERILFYSNELGKTGLEEIKDIYGKEITPFGKIIEENKQKLGLTTNLIAEYGKFYGKINHGGSVSNWINGKSIPRYKQWEKICSLFNIKNKYEELLLEYEKLRLEYEKLRRQFNNKYKLTDVIKFSQQSNITKRYNHPTQKPPLLIRSLLETVSRKGFLVLDPMMGSGVVGEECKRLFLDFIGIELDKEYFEIAKKRIENTQTPFI